MSETPGAQGAATVAGPSPNSPGYRYNLEVERRRVELKMQARVEALGHVKRRVELDEARVRGMTDFYYCMKDILGFKDLYPPLHGPLCQFVADKECREKLVLIPRGTYKSTTASIGYPIYSLVNNPDERIAILSVKANLAETFMREIVLRISAPSFQELYGHILGHPKDWPLSRSGELRLPRTGAKTGPSLFITSVESSEVGYHFSKMIYDDIVNEQNSSTPEQLEKTWEWFTRQIAVLDPDGEQIVVGTRWHWDDCYGRIEKLGTWKVFHRSVYDEKGKSIFPTLLPEALLEKYKRRLGNKFALFYLNDPTGCGQNRFDLKKLRWIEYEKRHPDSWRYIIVDPATTTNEWSCPSGIVIGDALPNGTFVVTDAISTKQDPDLLVRSLIELIKIHKPTEVVIETEAALNTIYFWLEKELREQEIWVQLNNVQNSRKVRKEARPSSLLLAVNEGKIVFRRGMAGAKILERELATFPKGETDDVLVALSFIPQHVRFPPESDRGPKPEKFKSDDPRARRIAFLMEHREKRRERKRGRMPHMRRQRALMEMLK